MQQSGENRMPVLERRPNQSHSMLAYGEEKSKITAVSWIADVKLHHALRSRVSSSVK